MPSFQDSAFLVLLALLLFGPKGLAKIAREVGKLMGEFRRASNEFRLQMEDEFRQVEQADRQKKIEAIEAAAPVKASFGPAEEIADPEHPHIPSGTLAAAEDEPSNSPLDEHAHVLASTPTAPEPIAIAGDLSIMPPSTGLPAGRSSSSSSLAGVFDSIPHVPESAAESAHPALPQPEPTEVHNG